MIPEKMHAVLTYGPQDMRYELMDVPAPGPGEIRVWVDRVGMGINLDPLVTHNLPLQEFKIALDIARQRREHAIKVSMTP